MKIVYGPVASWRLGRSLGVDPLGGTRKWCTFDCCYCQLGPTPNGPVLRDAWVSPSDLGDELWATREVPADYITFSGLGEPTLASNLGDLLQIAREVRKTPLAVLTNGSLLGVPSVRAALKLADYVIAKVDAVDDEVFLRINRPRIPCLASEAVEGIRTFRAMYGGRLAIQMMFVAGNATQAEPLAALTRSLMPSEVQLNTPLRPSATPPLGPDVMAGIARVFEGLPAFQVYPWRRPMLAPLDESATSRRRPEYRQVYAVPKPTVVTLDPAATRLRRPEAGKGTAMDGGGMDCRRELT
jgi:wyosine [tRNA(Phe)-imidazoG37] synthetase (radical SAM superfamily)